MPRFDGSYPSFGVEFSPDDELNKQVLPQIECDFSGISGPTNLTGGATPFTTTGSQSLDPSVFTDLSGTLPSGSYGVIQSGLLSNATLGDPCGFTWPRVGVCSGGSGVAVHYRPQNISSISEYVELRFLDASSNGYVARLDSTGTLAFRVSTLGVQVTIKSIAASVTSENSFSLMWDGGSRFKASFGDKVLTEVDDTFNPLDMTISVVLSNARISSVRAGASLGLKSFDVTSSHRDVTYGSVQWYSDPEMPWSVNGTVPVSGTDDVPVMAALDSITSTNLIPLVTLAFAPPEFLVGDATPGGAPDPDLHQGMVDDWVTGAVAQSTMNFVIWKDNYGMRCGVDSGSSSYWATPECSGDEWDYARYKDLYTKAYTSLKAGVPGCRVYGPNCFLSARGEGYDATYGGVLVDSRDMDFLQAFLDDLAAATPPFGADGIAVSGAFPPSQWGDLIPVLQTMCGQFPLIITAPPPEATPTQSGLESYSSAGFDGLDSGDVFVVDASGFTSYSPKLVTDSYDSSFSATLVVPYQMKNTKLKVAAITDEILLNSWVRIVSDHATPYVLADELPSGNGSLLLGNLEEGTYSITVSGDQGKSGTAMLRVGIYSDNFDVLTLADTKFLGS